jgi:medium-chain acyl-[acyl-carrier-protein] hydrolase
MSQPSKKGSSFVLRPRPTPAAFRLFCFPYAGGGASIYRSFVQAFPGNIELVPVQPPGRENRMGEKPFKRIGDLLDQLEGEILPLLDRPYAFFGYSLGATVAFELALRLDQRHHNPPRHVMVAARQPPHLESRRKPIHDLPHDEFLHELRELEGTPAEAFEHPELMELMMPLLRADFEIVETYEALKRPALSCTLTAMGGLKDRDVTREDMEGWRGYGQDPFKLRMFPGGHFFLNENRDSLLAAILQEVLPKMG